MDNTKKHVIWAIAMTLSIIALSIPMSSCAKKDAEVSKAVAELKSICIKNGGSIIVGENNNSHCIASLRGNN